MYRKSNQCPLHLSSKDKELKKGKESEIIMIVTFDWYISGFKFLFDRYIMILGEQVFRILLIDHLPCISSLIITDLDNVVVFLHPIIRYYSSQWQLVGFLLFRWFTVFEFNLICNHVFPLMVVHYLLSCVVRQSKTQSLASYDTQTTVLVRAHGFHQTNTLGLPT